MKKLLAFTFTILALAVSAFALQLENAEQADGVLLAEGTYASMPETLSDKGILIYFDNGNPSDTYSTSNISLIGLQNEYTADGYATRGIWDCVTLVDDCYTHGLAIVPASGETFTYSNGDALNGTLTLYAEVYNNTTGELGFFGAVRPQANGWTKWCSPDNPVYTNGNASGRNTAPNAWTTIAFAHTPDSKYIGMLRNQYDGHTKADFVSVRSVYVYYMPTDYVKYEDVDGVKLVDLGGMEKYQIPAPLMSDKWVDKNDYTVTFNAGDTVNVSDISGKTLMIEQKFGTVPEEITDKGALVFFDNGNTDDSFNKTNAVLKGQSKNYTADGYYTRGILDCTTLLKDCHTHGLGIQASDGISFKYNDGTELDGTITFGMNVYNTTSGSLRFYSAIYPDPGGWNSWCGGVVYSNWDATGRVSEAGAWSDMTVTTSTDANFITILRAGWENHNIVEDFVSFRYAYAYYLPTNHIFLINGEEKTLVDLNGKTEYTFGENVDGSSWKVNGENIFYTAGQTVNVADISGKTIVSAKKYAEKPEEVTEDGILIFFDNGNASDAYSDSNIVLKGQKGDYTADGYYTRGIWDCTALLGDCHNHGIGIGVSSGDSFTYADGTPLEGKIKFAVEVYNNTDANLEFFNAAYPNPGGWSEWVKGYACTNWIKKAAASKTWSTVSYTHTADATMIGLLRAAYDGHIKADFMSFRSAYAYYMPENKIYFSDGEEKTLIDLTGKTTYTLPDSASVWYDGISAYQAGTELQVADVKGRTFVPTTQAALNAPVTEADIEMRVTNNVANNGIRFKASILPSNKEKLDEMGFIVARGDVLEQLGEELSFNVSATDGKVNYAYGAAYTSDGEKNIIFGSKDDGSEIFTCVCVGIDINNKAQVTTKLVARPYAKMTIDGKQITVYGETNTATMVSVAEAIKTGVENGRIDASEIYNNAYYECNGVRKNYIDTIIETSAAE